MSWACWVQWSLPPVVKETDLAGERVSVSDGKLRRGRREKKENMGGRWRGGEGILGRKEEGREEGWRRGGGGEEWRRRERGGAEPYRQRRRGV